MFYNILDKNRLDILPLLKSLKNDFYLAGGTGLALQLGHRDSYDFDFFSKKNIDTKKLFLKIKEIFSGYNIIKTQEEENTLSVTINNNIQLSFFTFPYKLMEKLIEEPYLNIASMVDIACMKISAIIGRGTNKDYIDLYYILQTIVLPELLKATSKKFPELDTSLVLKSLVYFEDVIEEPIRFKNNKEVPMLEVKKFIEDKVMLLS
jgi:hypothetical protein